MYGQTKERRGKIEKREKMTDRLTLCIESDGEKLRGNAIGSDW